MDRSVLRFAKAFMAAKIITDYYWMHTDGDNDGKVSIENVQRIVSRLTGLKIEKKLVDFDGEVVQGNVERFNDSVVIYVRKNQSEEDRRFTAIKELFHLVADDDGDFSVDVVKTIGDLVNYQQKALDGLASEELRSERNAEVMALEIIYPFEYRDADAERHTKEGAPLEEIATQRGVPVYWVRRALSQSRLDLTRAIWKSLPVNVGVPDLPEEGSGSRIVIRAEETPDDDEDGEA